MESIVLASSSPRRRELFEKYKIKHRVAGSDILEKTNPGERPEQIVMSLAFQKAYNVALDNRDNIVLGADTIVVYDNRILGKPKNEEDAFRMLEILSGKKHEVITAIALIHLENSIKVVEFEKTIVKFKELDSDFIRRYVATKEPLDKAGAYGIQDYGALLVEGIQGSYLNIVGLPLSKLNSLLNKYFNICIL